MSKLPKNRKSWLTGLLNYGILKATRGLAFYVPSMLVLSIVSIKIEAIEYETLISPNIC